jgi:hypothetical protein
MCVFAVAGGGAVERVAAGRLRLPRRVPAGVAGVNNNNNFVYKWQ